MNIIINILFVLFYENIVYVKVMIWLFLRKIFCLFFFKLNFDWFSKEKNLKVVWRFIKDLKIFGFIKKNYF